MTPDGGLYARTGVGLRRWQRPEEPVAPERAGKPIAEKESYGWLDGYQVACEVQQRCPPPLGVSGADREGDIQECGLEALARGAAARAECIIGAKCKRRITTDQDQGYWWPEMQSPQPLGQLTGEVARQGGRAPRQATLTVATRRVSFTGALRHGGRLPALEVTVLYAQERRPPRGEEPIEGLLLRSLPVEEVASACTVVQWERGRWEIELCFRVRKQGC